MFNLILFGPPGSGKGTQSEKLLQKYALKHLSTGDLLRTEIAAKTPLGIEAKKFIDNGLLVPDKVVIDMISFSLQANSNVKGFLFDGFPRTVGQAQALDNLLNEHETEIALMLSLQVAEEELVKRLLNRGASSGRSDDTNESIIRARIKEYHDKTSAVAGYYAQFQKVVNIKGQGSVEEISELLFIEIDRKINGSI